jgi:phosphatidylserine decarboxylase
MLPDVSTPLANTLSHLVGWLADRRIPRPLRAPIHRAFARYARADLSEARPPLEAYPSLGAFFVRRLVDGARTFPDDPQVLPSPCDGTLQALDRIEADTLLQAKGRPYSASELLAGLDRSGPGRSAVELEGAMAWTIYLSPSDYHRVHCPMDATLEEVAWAGGARYSVAPKVLLRKPGVFVENERAVLRLESGGQPWFLVLVGAINVGRLRVVGVEHGANRPSRHDPRYERGEEIGRFELGSTAILIWPAPAPTPALEPALGQSVRMGAPLARLDR